MLIEKKYISPPAHYLIQSNPLAKCAYNEVANSILNNVTPGHDVFILNNTGKNCNGVVPVKERIYQILEDTYGWYREKPLSYFHDDAKKAVPLMFIKNSARAVMLFMPVLSLKPEIFHLRTAP